MDENELPPLQVSLVGDAGSYNAVMDAAIAKVKADTDAMNDALKHATDVMVKELKLQAKTFGMTARETAIYKLEMDGASQEQIELARTISRTIDQLDREEEEFRQVMLAERAAEKAAKDLAEAQEKASKAMLGMANIGSQMKSLGRTMSLYLTTAIVAMGAASVNEFAKFDKALTETRAIMGPVTAEFRKEMRDTVLSMTEMSRFSPDELMMGLKGLAAAGLEPEKALKALGVVERFATAGAFDLERATQLLTDSQSAMGLAVKDSELNMKNMIRVSDALVKAGDQSTASPEQFAEALSNGAADAKQWGAEIETVMALLDAYASKGNKGAAAGSDMARAFKLMKKAFAENSEEFKRNGIEVVDKATGEYRNFIDVISDLERAMVGMTGPQRTMMLDQLGFAALAQGAILPLVGMSDQMKEWEKAQRSATGYTANVAGVQMESFTNQMKVLWNQIKVIGIEIGNTLVPYIKILSSYVQAGIETWKGWSDEMKGIAIGAAVIVAAIGPLLVVVGMALTLTASLSASLATLGLTAYATAIGVGVLQVAMAGLAIGGIILIAKAMYELQPAITDLNDALARGKELTSELTSSTNKHRDALLDSMKAMQGPERVAALEAELALVEKNMYGNQKSINGTKKAVEELNTTWRSMTGNKLLAGTQLELKEQEEALKNNTAWAKQLKDQLNAARGVDADGKPKSGNTDSSINAEMAEEVDKLTKALELQQKTLGMTSEEAKIFKLELEGATAAQLAAARAASSAIKAFEDQKKAKKAAEDKDQKLADDIKQWKLQAEMVGMSSRQQHIYKAALEGATKAQLDEMRAADKAATAIETHKKEIKDAADLVKKYSDPLTKLKKEQQELATMFVKGLIPLEVFNKGMDDTGKAFDKEYKATFKVGGVEAVEAGTAAALAKLSEFQAKTKSPMKIDMKKAKEEALANATEAEQAKVKVVAQGQEQQKKLHPKKKAELAAAEPNPYNFKSNATARATSGIAPEGKPGELKELLVAIRDNTAPDPITRGSGNTLTVKQIRFKKTT